MSDRLLILFPVYTQILTDKILEIIGEHEPHLNLDSHTHTHGLNQPQHKVILVAMPAKSLLTLPVLWST